MSHQCICNKTTTTLFVQTVGTCHTCQELSAKTCNLNICHAHMSLEAIQSEREHSMGGCFKLL